jgi:hypothetical protein
MTYRSDTQWLQWCKCKYLWSLVLKSVGPALECSVEYHATRTACVNYSLQLPLKLKYSLIPASASSFSPSPIPLLIPNLPSHPQTIHSVSIKSLSSKCLSPEATLSKSSLLSSYHLWVFSWSGDVMPIFSSTSCKFCPLLPLRLPLFTDCLQLNDFGLHSWHNSCSLHYPEVLEFKSMTSWHFHKEA